MLLIQKLILLLSDFHFNQFLEFLKNEKAVLPAKLIKEIRNYGWNQPESDVLCEKVYGDKENKTKKKFLQLTHHTLKLSYYLSRNYPSYLKQNLLLIEEHINRGEKTRADQIAECLNDISEKLEDFTTRIEVLKFLSQRAFISESREAGKLHQTINVLINAELNQNEIYGILREKFHFKGKENIEEGLTQQNLDLFNKLSNSEFISIQILARYARVYALFFTNNHDFYKTETLNELESIENDLYKNAFIIFPFLEDIYFKILSLKLQIKVHEMDTVGTLREAKRLINDSNSILFWKSFVNVPELFAIAIQASHFISHYGYTFKKDHYKNLPDEVKQQINFLKSKLITEMEKPFWNEGNLIKLINARSLYAGLLLLGQKEDIKRGIDIIEETFISFQQIPFQKFLDGMFAGLIIGYFSLENHEKVSDTFKRYKKITGGNSVIQENDFTIHAYYYVSQFILTQRNQYREKLATVFEETKGKSQLQQVKNLINELAEYYSIKLNT